MIFSLVLGIYAIREKLMFKKYLRIKFAIAFMVSYNTMLNSEEMGLLYVIASIVIVFSIVIVYIMPIKS